MAKHVCSGPHGQNYKLFHSRLWGYDPLFENKYKFSIHDVLRLQKDDGYRGVFHFSNHPVTSVWIMGDVVSSFAKDTFTSFKVDDGTGCIKCILWRNDDDSLPPANNIEQGCLVTIIGKVTEFRGNNSINISIIEQATDPNMEICHWLDIIRLKPLYSMQYTIPITRNQHLVKELKGSLCSYLHTQDMGTFTLYELAIRCKSNAMIIPSDVYVKDVDIDLIIKEAFGEMIRCGYFVPQEELPNHYKFFSNNDLVPILLQIIRNSKDLQLTVQEVVYEILKEEKDLCLPPVNISCERIEQTIEMMVEKNDIFPVGDKEPMEYKIVD